jgi:hypothetical protein
MRNSLALQDINRQKDMLVVKHQLEVTFKQRIDAILDMTFQKYDAVQKSFSKFFNSDDLECNFNRKANIELVEEL